MTDKNLTILGELPPMVIAGSGDDFGIVTLATVGEARDAAARAFKRVDELSESPDDLATLRSAVNTLSDALNLLAGEVYQIGAGLREGRIAVRDGE